MDDAGRRLPQLAPAVASTGNDWRAHLDPGARRRIINKIKDTLSKHLPVTPGGGVNELLTIAERFEEKIYSAATSQSDYLRKISLKMLSMETKPLSNPVVEVAAAQAEEGSRRNKRKRPSDASGFAASTNRQHVAAFPGERPDADMIEEIIVQEKESPMYELDFSEESAHTPDVAKVVPTKCSHGCAGEPSITIPRRLADDAISALNRLVAASSAVAELTQNLASNNSVYSVKHCMEILYRMNNVDPEKKLKAAKAFSDSCQREIFVEMTDELRSLWIRDL